ncbi:MAG: DivIVA domain-containing protein [Bacteroidetes bacterium]|nr:MAG: DivIVA domain-containing protein [Bacteroidota bacterium]
MKITPLDIKKQEFKKVLRGYDPIEVDAFLDTLSNEFSELLKQSKELREEYLEMEIQLRDYRQKERDLQQILMQAQETSARSIENSRKEAELIIQEAELKASQIIDHARMDVMRTREELANLRAKKEVLISRLKVLLNSEIEMIRSLEADDEAHGGESAPAPVRESFRIDDVLKKL